jgi:hypothetical protein
VTRASGITACLEMLLAIYLDLGLRCVRLGAAVRSLRAAINTVATGLDTHSTRIREPGGGLFANFHIVEEAQ